MLYILSEPRNPERKMYRDLNVNVNEALQREMYDHVLRLRKDDYNKKYLFVLILECGTISMILMNARLIH